MAVKTVLEDGVSPGPSLDLNMFCLVRLEETNLSTLLSNMLLSPKSLLTFLDLPRRKLEKVSTSLLNRSSRDPKISFSLVPIRRLSMVKKMFLSLVLTRRLSVVPKMFLLLVHIK